MDPYRLIYWLSTGTMSVIFIFSAGMYFTEYEMVAGFFKSLGYPIYLIYPLAIVKILGVIAILTRRSQLLKEWAYAGFFFDSAIASWAHWEAGHGLGLSVLALVLVLISRWFDELFFSRVAKT